eukprot:CAMPEP_0196251534 /NCGR_PEP_ID=MMETSP0913-20130531/47635_1 /TAXON_ID=49265 /ORGANISM="Thalassiosira rotula, Strain GSO102" /LENGTH=74 /DNA_ID=CAMNT_0041537811 /DNA_START=43 /DNA_END=267 /DNA_ORIENTATION=-
MTGGSDGEDTAAGHLAQITHGLAGTLDLHTGGPQVAAARQNQASLVPRAASLAGRRVGYLLGDLSTRMINCLLD